MVKVHWFWQKRFFKPNVGDTFEVTSIGNGTNILDGQPAKTYAQLQEATQYETMIGLVHLRIPGRKNEYQCLGGGFIFRYGDGIAFALEHGSGNHIGGYFYPRSDDGIMATVFRVNYTVD